MTSIIMKGIRSILELYRINIWSKIMQILILTLRNLLIGSLVNNQDTSISLS